MDVSSLLCLIFLFCYIFQFIFRISWSSFYICSLCRALKFLVILCRIGSDILWLIAWVIFIDIRFRLNRSHDCTMVKLFLLLLVSFSLRRYCNISKIKFCGRGKRNYRCAISKWNWRIELVVKFLCRGSISTSYKTTRWKWTV